MGKSKTSFKAGNLAAEKWTEEIALNLANDLIAWMFDVVEKEGGELSDKEASQLAGEAMAKCEMVFNDLIIKAIELSKKRPRRG